MTDHTTPEVAPQVTLVALGVYRIDQPMLIPLGGDLATFVPPPEEDYQRAAFATDETP